MMDAVLPMDQFYEQYSTVYNDIQYFGVNGIDPNHVNQFNATVSLAN